MQLAKIHQKQILEVSKSLLTDYQKDLLPKEIEEIKKIIKQPPSFLASSLILEPILQKIWDKELITGNYKVIAWTKSGKKEHSKERIVIFATISEKDNIVSFCDLTIGEEYAITYDSILGAYLKDGATLLEDKKNEYTIGQIKDKYINSYNGASKLFTPKQLVAPRQTNYPSNHNELILNPQKIKYIKQIEIENSPKR